MTKTPKLDQIMTSYLEAEFEYREAFRKVSKSRELLSNEVSAYYNLDSRATTQVICMAKRLNISINQAYSKYFTGQ